MIFSNRGFTLIELVAVITIVSVLSFVGFVRLSNNDSSLSEARRDVLMALRKARLQSMIKLDGTIRFIASSNRITIENNGINLHFPDVSYPLYLPGSVGIAENVILTFDSYGSTQATVLNLTKNGMTQTIHISGAGYAY